MEENKRCQLPNNEEIKFESIQLFEIFNIEDFGRLKKGLNKLYKDYSGFGIRNTDYNNLFDKDNLSFGGWRKLPIISNYNLDNNPIDSLNMDLGEFIKFIDMQLFYVLPSTVVLKIHAYLDEQVSKQLNEIIKKHHETEILYHKFPDSLPNNQKYFSFTTSSHTGPENVKANEVNEFRLNIKKDVTSFILNFDLKGLFLKTSKDISLIPSIEFFSLDFPNDQANLILWGRKNSGFLHCLKTYLHPFNTYKLDDEENSYLFFGEETNDKNKFSNYFVFMSSKNDNDDLIFDYENRFEFIVFRRWLQIHKKRVTEFGNIISEEIENLRKNKLQDVLKHRKIISKGIFHFQRFKSEYKLININKTGFKSIKNKDIDLNASQMNYIKQEIEEIEEIINTFNKHFDVILGLKNIEYSKNMQNKVYWLTIVVIILAITQIILVLKELKLI